MKNSQFRINIITKHGKIQRWRKRKDHWEQTSTRGIVRRATAEQVLNHLLPLLVPKNKIPMTLEVKYSRGRRVR
jgi:hypothetical protein